MTTFDLELRITTFGSVISWKVFLEDSTNDSQLVTGWSTSSDGYLYKELPDYKISDNSLEVFASCLGIRGGKVTCEVVINEERRSKKVEAKVEDRKYAEQSYEINEP